MRTLLLGAMLFSGVVFMVSVLLMSPKGSIGFGIGGAASTNEYGSKKSIEHRLKRIALVAAIIFGVAVVILPYTA
ncbi:MAG TPA: preprotein translocase subunit SecG [Candidatus Absconditabacterales bacterium]|nr:preprotein translocase subunit SecG [Candidatus Absconditabacterales bacterium]HMT26903.1 preprotein translocase subunit SecG [Candidatus Absconditabacterales bacterium]